MIFALTARKRYQDNQNDCYFVYDIRLFHSDNYITKWPKNIIKTYNRTVDNPSSCDYYYESIFILLITI